MSDLENELKKLKVPELRERCQRLGIDSKGTKGLLIERILSHHGLQLESIVNETVIDTPVESVPITQDSAPIENFKEMMSPLNRLEIHASDEEKPEVELDFVDDSNTRETKSLNSSSRVRKFEKIKSPNQNDNYPNRSISIDEYKNTKEMSIENTKGSLKILNEEELNFAKPPKYLDHVHLDSYNSDLYLKIEDEANVTSSNFINEFSNFYCGVKASHGFTAGYLCYSVKFLERLKDIENKSLAGSICIGYSSKDDSLHIGDSSTSFGFDSSGVIVHENKIVAKMASFDVGDQITALINFQANSLTYTFQINGIDVGHTATIEISSPLVIYPHIYFKNVRFMVNFKFSSGVHGSLESITRALVPNHRPPLNVEASEVILMVGLIGAGKTTWVQDFTKHSSVRYYAIGRCLLYDRWRKIWEEKVPKLSDKVVNSTITKMVEIASRKGGNYIIDQTNVSNTSRAKRLEVFKTFGSKKAVVIIPRLSEHAKRFENYRNNLSKGIGDAKEFHVNDLISCKERFVLPLMAEGFTEVIYVDTNEKGALEIAADYKYEANQYKNSSKAKQDKKRPRIIPPEGVKETKSGYDIKSGIRTAIRKRSPRELSRNYDKSNRITPSNRSGYTTVGKSNRDREASINRRRITSPPRRNNDFYGRRKTESYHTQHGDYKSKSFFVNSRRGYSERDSRIPPGYESSLLLSRGHIDRPHVEFGRNTNTRGQEYSSWNSGVYNRDRDAARPYPDRVYDKYPRPSYTAMKPSTDRYESYLKRDDRHRY